MRPDKSELSQPGLPVRFGESAAIARASVAGSGKLPEEAHSVFWLERWNLARRNWKWLAGMAAVGAGAGLVIAAFVPVRYHARTTLEIQGISDNVLKAQDGNPNGAAESEFLDMQTQIRIMQSDSLTERALARMAERRGIPVGTTRQALPQALRLAAKSLKVQAVGPTRIVEIASDSSDPKVAADFANTLAEEFIDQHVESRWQGTRTSADKLRRGLADMRTQLETSEDALQAFAGKSGLILTDDKNSVSEERLRQLQAELSRVQGERVSRQSRYDAILHQSDAGVRSASDDPSIRLSQDKLTELQRQMADLATIYTPVYPKVKRLEAQIPPLEAAIHGSVAAIRERAREEFEEAQQREQLLDAAYHQQAGVVSVAAERKVHYDMLKREVDSTRTLYDTLLSRVKESGFVATLRGSNVRVLDEARAAVSPYQPRTWQLALLGGMVGLFFGGVLANAREETNQRIQAPGELDLLLNLRELGAVPPIKAADSDAGVRDAFRCILTSLLFHSPEGCPQVLVITSAYAGDGKTTVANHLATALTEIGKRVLLIDADLRTLPGTSASGSEQAGGNQERGLTQLLACPVTLEAAEMARFVQTSPQRGLMVLNAGTPNPETCNLLHSPRLKELFAYGRKNFDIVLVDTPPLLQIPDARVIGRAADGVVIVARAGRTTREAALAVRQRLAEDGTPMTGSVLNDWNCKNAAGTYGRKLNQSPSVSLAAHAHSA